METLTNWIIVTLISLIGVVFCGLYVRLLVWLFCLGYGC